MGTIVGVTAVGIAGGVTSLPVDVPGGDVGDQLEFITATNNNTATWSNATGDLTAFEAVTVGTILFRRLTDGSEDASYTFTKATNTANPAMGICIRHRGYGVLNDISVTSATGTSIVMAAVTAAEANSDILNVAIRLTTGATTWTGPGDNSGTLGNPIERYDQNSTGTVMRMAIGEEMDVAAGSTGTRTWSTASGGLRGLLLAFNEPDEELPPEEGMPLTLWNGTTEAAQDLLYWNGTAEVPYTITEVSS